MSVLQVMAWVVAAAMWGQTETQQRSSGKTRTQTIHVGEPVTNAPGGNPGRTTRKTGNQSPFPSPAVTPVPTPTPTPAGASGSPCPQDGGRTVPKTVAGWSVTDGTGGGKTIGPLTVGSGTGGFGDRVACDLETVAGTASGKLLLQTIQGQIQRLQNADRASDAYVKIELQTDSSAGPLTQPGGTLLKWLRVQPASLGEVYGNIPTRPRRADGSVDWTAPATAPQPLAGWLVWANSWARGTGIGATVFIDPSSFPLTNWNSTTPADVALYHELVHALRFLQGQANRTPRFLGDRTKADPTWLIEDEFEVINGNFQITENVYRGEKGLPARMCVAPVCF